MEQKKYTHCEYGKKYFEMTQFHLKTKQEINVIFRYTNIKDANWNSYL